MVFIIGFVGAGYEPDGYYTCAAGTPCGVPCDVACDDCPSISKVDANFEEGERDCSGVSFANINPVDPYSIDWASAEPFPGP